MKYLKYIIGIPLLIIVLIALAGMYKFNYLASQDGYDADGNKIKTQEIIEPTEEIVEEINNEEIENIEDVMVILVPDANLDDSVVFTEYTVPKSAGVLNATYKKLFEINSIENGYNGLTYDAVLLDNGVARVFLTGSWFPKGDLSGAYMRRNINETAFQFKTVDSIEVYVNDELFDWCIDSQADLSESGCDIIPQLWIDTK